MNDIKRLGQVFSPDFLERIHVLEEAEDVFPSDPMDGGESHSEKILKTKYKQLYGRRFQDATLDNYNVYCSEQKGVLDICKAYCEIIPKIHSYDKYDLILVGNTGTGKSHLTYSIAKKVLDHTNEMIIVKFIEIMRRIKTAWSMHNEREQSIIDEYSNVQFLFLEEIGIGYGTENEKLFLFEILDNRYKRKLPTIITSNLSSEQFKAYIDSEGIDRVWSRLNETALILEFTWESHRVRPQGD